MELFKLVGKLACEGVDETKNDLEDATSKAETAQSKMTDSFKKIAVAIGTYFTATKIIDFGKQCLNAASNVQEMENKFNVVFEGITDEVNAWANEFEKATGRNSTNIKTYLADNQNMFVGMGMTRTAGAELSQNLVSLALDLASFNNLNEDDAVNAMSKAIMGESESAKSLGAVLNDNTRSMAMAVLGYEGRYDALDETQKMEVNYQAILMQSSDAIGDCERSAGSYKDSQIRLNSSIKTLQETVGVLLLPIFSKANQAVTGLVGKFTEFVSWVSGSTKEAESFRFILGLVASMVGAVIAVLGAWKAALVISELWTKAVTTAQALFNAVLNANPVMLVIIALAALVAAFIYLWNTCEPFKNFMIGLWDSLKSGVNSVVNIFQSAFNGIVNSVNNAKSMISSAINAIKGFFNFNISWPSIKLPHFSISGSFNPVDWLTGGLPKIGVDWYANGGIMERPTAFGINGQNIMVGGEAGPEAIAPLAKLEEYYKKWSSEGNNEMLQVLKEIRDVIKDEDRIERILIRVIDSFNMTIELDGRVLGRIVKEYAG